MASTLRVLRCAIAVSFADYAAIYTWRTWLGAWLSRILAQVAFYALIGRMLGDPITVRYLLVGSAVWMAAMEACLVVTTSANERRIGTLPLLIVAPTDPFVVLMGRSVMWIVSGVATASLSLAILAPVFHVLLSPWRVVATFPLIALTSVGTYCMAMTPAGLAMRLHGARNVIANLLYMTLLIFCGVQAPLTFWPAWVRTIAAVIPLTHSLAAVRGVLDGTSLDAIGRQVAWTLLTTVGWIFVAWLAFRGVTERGRRTGSIEFG
jgi:ABC-2 type transport system permease protein